MLKIIDYFDASLLKNYGFKPKYDEDTGEIIAYIKINNKKHKGIIIKEATKRKLRIFKYYRKGKTEWKINPYSEYIDLDTLYDLIQAGLVEKVEE